MPSPSDGLPETRLNAKPEPGRPEHAAVTRTVVNVVLAPELESNASAVACAVAAIRALPYVADVTTRKVRARPLPTQRTQTT